MVRLNWGTFLAIVFPGAVATLALQHYSSAVSELLGKPNQLSLSGGTLLLLIAGISGGIIEGLRRLVIDEAILNDCQAFSSKIPPAEESFFFYLDDRSLPVFNAGIDESYRYFTFFANLSLAILFWVVTRVGFRGGITLADLALFVLAVVLSGSAYVQHKYFRQFLEAFRARNQQRLEGRDSKNVGELAGTGEQD